MTDPDLLALKAALQAAPVPDPAAKAAALARAMDAFEKTAAAPQGNPAGPRPKSDRPFGAGVLKGLRAMFATMKLRPILTATTSAAALAVGVFVMLPMAGHGPIAPPPLTPDANYPAETAPNVLPNAPSPAPRERMAPDALAGLAANEVPAASILERRLVPSLDIRVEQENIAVVDTTETFANADANPVKITAEDPVSTFSVDVDTASYAVVRSSLMNGALPNPDEIRVEEMINYFPYNLPGPEAGEAPFRPTITVMQTPWNPGTRLVQIALQGRMPAIADRPPLNLVFLIDTSGSMESANKLPLLRQSLALMLGELRPEDQVAIVTYAGSAGEVLPPTPASEKAKILSALDNLSADGSTAGAEGLELAYKVAESMGGKGQVSRILLATDGDFNVGVQDPAGLEAYVAKKRDSGVYLSVLGFGRGNLNDATMQSLAQNGNGTAAYIDTLQEARKVLVDQLTGALFPIADDVKIQVEWNPAEVAEYRLIGYETRALRREDFNNDAVDAGEIGAGHQVTAIYEVTAPGSAALLSDPLRYGTESTTVAPAPQGPELGFLRLRYKAPGEDVSALIETPIPAKSGEAASDDAKFAAAIAGMGQLLRGSVYLKDWGWDQAIDLALGARGDDPFGYRIEAVNLMRMAKTLSK